MDLPADYVLVGAGSAGSVIARRLVDRTDATVLVLEAGGRDRNPAIHDPRRMHELWHSPEDWDYFSIPQRHAAGRRLHLPRGRVLGGSHALNATIWVRGNPADYDEWAALGNPGWAWRDVEPLFRRIERYDRDLSGGKGMAGLLDVLTAFEPDPVQRDILLAPAHPGDLTIYETSRPYTMVFDGPYRQLVLMLPRNRLRLPEERITEITGRRVPGDRGAGALFSVLLRQLAGQLDGTDLLGHVRLADNILDLLVTVYAEQLDLADRRQSTRPLMLTILSYVERHLADPGLSPDRIATAHYISTRYLHKLFHEEHTTVVRWLRERRLERCRHDLRDPMQADRPVGVIAAGWGFADPAHFSRVFRTAYGSSPNEYRARYFARR